MAVQQRENAPALGALTVNGQRNGADHADRLPAHASNFVNGERFTILPDPYGDEYLGGLAAHLVMPGEIGVVAKLIPGLEAEYIRLHLLEPGQLLEIPHRVEDGDFLSPYAFPHGDVLERLSRQLNNGTLRRDTRAALLANPLLLLPTIIGPEVREQANEIGMTTLTTPDSDRTNNKQDLREHAEEFGINMMPGRVISGEITPDAIAGLVAEFGNLPHGVWVKLPGGSGGDTVMKVEHVTEDTLRAAIAEMHARFDESAELRAARNLEANWPDDHFAPNGVGLIIEQDAENLGERLVLGSAHCVSSANGSVEILGHFEQITDNGSFVGSGRFYPAEEIQRFGDETTARRVQELIDDQIRATATYNAEVNGYHGIQGPDYVVIRRPDGEIIVRTLELNTRPIISTYADFAARKLGVPHWINTNITLDRNIASFNDFAQSIGPDMVYNPDTHEGVLILASRSVVGEDESGQEQVIASPHVKVLILAPTQERAQALKEKLKERGIRLGTIEVKVEEQQ